MATIEHERVRQTIFKRALSMIDQVSQAASNEEFIKLLKNSFNGRFIEDENEKAPFLLRAMRSLPYHDVLPAIGGNTVFVQKIRTKI